MLETHPTTDAKPARRRVAGVTVPLFSIRSRRSFGIGEIGDLFELGAWLAEAGFSLVQLLPLGEIAGDESSPYGALSAFGIDPMYISYADVPDITPSDMRAAIGGSGGAALLERARGATGIDYEAVRTLKRRALHFAFEVFSSGDLKKGGLRAASLAAFLGQNEWWLADYALFRAVKDAHAGKPWWEWPAPLARREPGALEAARRALSREILRHQYAQWIAHGQWGDACARLRARGVSVMGDLPFMVGGDSADVWANQREFRLDMAVGVPPDQFDEDGQDWGLPPYHWDRMRADNFAWIRRRALYTGLLYDRFRIDHLVGFYRTYMRPMATRKLPSGKLAKGAFDPPEEVVQLAHGEEVVRAMVEGGRERGAALVAEDLGTVPDFVRASLARMGVPGYKVLIWEKDGDVFRDPKKYPEVSVACFGTHDTAPVAVWWEGLSASERRAALAIPGLAAHEEKASFGEKFTPELHRALLDLIHGSGSELTLLLMQDVLGSRERINTPSTVGPQNWTYRLPGTVEELRADRAVQRLWAMVRESITKSGRAP